MARHSTFVLEHVWGSLDRTPGSLRAKLVMVAGRVSPR